MLLKQIWAVPYNHQEQSPPFFCFASSLSLSCFLLISLSSAPSPISTLLFAACLVFLFWHGWVILLSRCQQQLWKWIQAASLCGWWSCKKTRPNPRPEHRHFVTVWLHEILSSVCTKQGVAEQLFCCFPLRSNRGCSEVVCRLLFQDSLTLSGKTYMTESI